MDKVNDVKNRKIVYKFLNNMLGYTKSKQGKVTLKKYYNISHIQLKNLVDNKLEHYTKTHIKNLKSFFGGVALTIGTEKNASLMLLKSHDIKIIDFLHICKILEIDNDLLERLK